MDSKQAFVLHEVQEDAFVYFRMNEKYFTPEGGLKDTLLLEYTWANDEKGPDTLVVTLMTATWEMTRVTITLNYSDYDRFFIQDWLDGELAQTEKFFKEKPLPFVRRDRERNKGHV